MNNIFILDGQTDEVLGHINKKYVIDNEHEKDLPSHKDYFRFTVLGENKHAEHLTKRNGLIVPGEDGELLEFRIFESIKYRNSEGLFIEVHALATYLDLKNQKIFDPHKTSAETALQHATIALGGTEWQVGEIDFKGIRTLTFDNPLNSYDYILRISREFELEPRFYVETDGNKIMGRYVDLVERIGEFRGRTIEFGRDLQRIERKEDTSNIVTALWVYGPEKEDGSRLKVLVEDDEARQRWGRRGQHIIDYYEPQTENQDITEERLKTLGEMELRKRINAVVTYEAEILDLENVPGLENKKIRFGDTIRIKDTKFNPPLYLEARVFNVKRDVFNKAKKTVQLGDYREYTEEEIKALFRQMQEEIRRRLDRMAIVSITSTAGNVFKNAQGETELTARTFVSGAERDEDGTLYDYQWMRFDKDGNHDTNFYAEGKTITVTANDIDEKATYRVLVAYELEVINTAEITISNVFDGEDGEQGPPGEQGPKGEDGQGVDNITIEYYLSDSDSTQIGGTWTETKPTYQPDKYLWIRQKITYKNPTSIEYTTPVLDDSWKAIEIADEAKQEAEEAKQEAQQAQTTADGKNTIIFSATEPSTEGRKIGDTWFDTSRDNLMHRFNGIEWVEAKWGEQSIVANSITANHIKSLVGLNVNDQFIVDANGNVKFAGHLEGATGSFISEGSYDGVNHKVDINRIITIENPSYKSEITPIRISQTDKNSDVVYHYWGGVMLVSHTNGQPIAGVSVDPSGYLSIDAHEGYNWLNINVAETTFQGRIVPQVHSSLSLLNGWQNYGGSYITAAVTKSADGMVYLRGLIRNGQTGSNYACARLPAGCRPLQREIFAVFTNNRIGRIDITSDGYIWMTNVDSVGVSLSGVSFRAEN